MYKPDPEDGYWRTITYYHYTEAGELDEGHQLRLKFRSGISRSERTALFAQAADGEQQRTDKEICDRLVLAVADGEISVPIEEAMDIQNVLELTYREYLNSCRELREKNLSKQPATG